MAHATGYITVETEIDLDMHENEIEIEFDGLSDVIDTAIAEGHTPEEIIDYCFDEQKVNPSTFMQEYMTVEQIMALYQETVTNKLDLLALTVSNQLDRIEELKQQLAEATKTDAEALKDVAY